MAKKTHKTSIGGQALIEGVMMRGVTKTAMANRMPDGSVDVEYIEGGSGSNLKWYKKCPFIRGCFNFIDSMLFGVKCLARSAEKVGFEEDETPSKFELKLQAKLGDNFMKVLTAIGMVLGVVLAIALFMVLPTVIVKLLSRVVALGAFSTLVEGVIKIIIFVLYLFFVTRMKEIQRVFQYHGAEHKSIACYEAGEELTVENVRKFSRFHPRCGTSFLILVLLISVLVFSMVTWNSVLIRVGLKILLLPVVVGISYELIKIAGRYNNIFTKIISAPGLWLQRLTTAEPDDSQIEVGIASLKAVLTDNPEDDKW